MKFKDLFLAPNLITIFRLVVSVLLFFNYEYIEFNNFILILIIALIGVSDAVDGYVARKFNQVSKLGTILDPFIDRIVFVLLITTAIHFFFLWAGIAHWR